jgi:uncharacterized protein
MKTALVTGASSGIGKAFAEVLAKEGYNLVLIARREKRLKAVKKDLEEKHNVTVMVIAKDLAAHDSTEMVFSLLQKKKLTVDILINNAGFGDYGFFLDRDWGKQKQMIQLNIIALTHFTKLFAQEMVKNGSGRIVNVASIASFFPGPLMSVYYATKSFVLHFSEALANEVRESGVTVTALCPGVTESEFQVAADMKRSKVARGGFPTSMDVALFGYKAMMRGDVVAIYGWKNKMIVFLARVLPRSLTVFLLRKFQDVVKE